MQGFFDKEFGIEPHPTRRKFHYETRDRERMKTRLVGAYLSRNVIKVRKEFESAIVLHFEFADTTKSNIEYSEFCAIAAMHGYKVSRDGFLENAAMRWR